MKIEKEGNGRGRFRKRREREGIEEDLERGDD